MWSFERTIADKVQKSFDVRLLKDEGDERFVLGVVLEPDGVDSQDDTISPEEIRNAAHMFMVEYQNIGIQHEELTQKIRILESYIAPADFNAGGQKVTKGTWILAVKVLDDALWQAIKTGEFTGFSIGGTAIRTPEN